MDTFKKYALVPQEVMSKHSPTEQQLTEFDKEMTQILKSSLSEYEKVIKYYELLQRKMKMENYNLPWSPEKEIANRETSKESEPSYDSMILNSVPAHLMKNTTNLLSILKSQPHLIKWNDKGEISIRNQPIENSNIIDLINLISTNKKKNVKAQDEFLKTLQDMNIPRHFIKNTNLHVEDKKSPFKKETSVISKRKRKSVTQKWVNF